ncbi:MAG: response regulator [Rhodospirillaceae bacterium]|nr:response regulator [Rhodospirillaceae bacterium]
MNTTSETAKPHILIVDDDAEIRDLLSRFLSKHDFRVTTAKDGRDMQQALKDWKIDLIVLDLMMPGDDGLTLCRQVRAESDMPIIMLTAMGEDVDRIIGLEVGADDYIAKPFNPRELSARIKAVLRRTTAPPLTPGVPIDEDGHEKILFEDFELQPSTRTLKKSGSDIVLTAGEYELLVAFVEHPRRVLNRDQLLDMARGRAAIPFDRAIDVQVGRLRKKIEPDAKVPTLIKTVRGGGYMFTPEVRKG